MYRPIITGTLRWNPSIGLQVGMYAELTKTITASDVSAYAALLGDTNPLHLDPAFAATTPFKRPIAHGMIAGGLIPTVFGAQIPSSLYISQTLNFKRPVYVGDTVTCRVEVISVKDRPMRTGVMQPLVTCTTIVTIDPTGKLAIEGVAECLTPAIVPVAPHHPPSPLS